MVRCLQWCRGGSGGGGGEGGRGFCEWEGWAVVVLEEEVVAVVVVVVRWCRGLAC